MYVKENLRTTHQPSHNHRPKTASPSEVYGAPAVLLDTIFNTTSQKVYSVRMPRTDGIGGSRDAPASLSFNGLDVTDWASLENEGRIFLFSSVPGLPARDGRYV